MREFGQVRQIGEGLQPVVVQFEALQVHLGRKRGPGNVKRGVLRVKRSDFVVAQIEFLKIDQVFHVFDFRDVVPLELHYFELE